MTAKHLFGQKVRAARLERSLSQESLAKLAGLHRTYVSDLERGTRNISLETIEKIACALEVAIVELFAWNDGSEDSRPREDARVLANLQREKTIPG